MKTVSIALILILATAACGPDVRSDDPTDPNDLTIPMIRTTPTRIPTRCRASATRWTSSSSSTTRARWRRSRRTSRRTSRCSRSCSNIHEVAPASRSTSASRSPRPAARRLHDRPRPPLPPFPQHEDGRQRRVPATTAARRSAGSIAPIRQPGATLACRANVGTSGPVDRDAAVDVEVGARRARGDTNAGFLRERRAARAS